MPLGVEAGSLLHAALLFVPIWGRYTPVTDRGRQTSLRLPSLRLKAHPGKTRLWDSREGVPFVGYRIFPWGAKLPRATVTRFRRHLRAIAEAYADGALDLGGAKQRLSGLIGHARPAHAEAVLADALDDYPLVRGG